MSTAVRSLHIPHRQQRQFAHAADIYRETLQELARESGAVGDVHFELRQILGSDVNLTVFEGPVPAGIHDTTVTFTRDGRIMFALLKNAGDRISLRNTYSFDEGQVREALRENSGSFSFSRRFHESNIHMLLSPIKFILPHWPKRPEDARVLRLSFKRDVQALEIEKFTLRLLPRQTFSVTTFFYAGEPIGEATHYFLDGGMS